MAASGSASGPRAATGTAHARAALLGNPSDGYGGRTLAVAIAGFEATATVAEATADATVPVPLVAASVTRFALHAGTPPTPLDVTCTTTIPRQVGLGGSSAIVIATLRALAAFHDVTLSPAELARLALAIEVEDLGIPAGPQDRLTQAHGGLLYMDFDPGLCDGSGTGLAAPLDPALLPPLFLAYRRDASEPSSGAHRDLRSRFERDQAGVRIAMSEVADLARRGRDALLSGDVDGFSELLDRNFDARRRMLPLDPRHVSMVEVARSHGACANYAGSGGAIVGTCRDPSRLDDLRPDLADRGCELILLRAASPEA